jgi:septal ring factor EnvC (AmiA/AmiB activator)
MTDGLEGLPARVGVVEQKLDALAASTDARLAQVDARFDQVDARFGQVDRRFAQVDRRFQQLEANIERRFEQVDEAFLEQRRYTEFAYERLDAKMDAGFARLETKIDGLAGVRGDIGRLERKLDSFIELNTRKRPRKQPPR